MPNIEVAGSLIPGTTNTPLDARTRRNTLAEMLTIDNPAVGMHVYVAETGKEYIVKTLKSKIIGGIETADRLIDIYELVPDKTELEKISVANGIRATVNGTVITQYANLADLLTYLNTLDTAATTGVVLDFAPGVYSAASDVAFPSLRMVLHGNNSELAITGNLSFPRNAILQNFASITATTITLKNSYVENAALTGAVVCNGSLNASFVNITGAVTVANELVLSRGSITGGIASTGSLILIDAVIQGSSASPLVSSTAGTVRILNTVIANAGTGGGVSCNNGATASSPNMFSNVALMNGTIAAGNAVTLLGTLKTSSAVTGNALVYMTGLMSDTDKAAVQGQLDSKATAAAVTALATEVSQKSPIGHTHDFGAYAELTKFEVYATDAVIPAGTVDSDTGLAYAVEVPAGMSHYFRLRSDTPQESNDIVIDWGDGSTSSVANQNYDSIYDAEWATVAELIYNFHHTYSSPGKYIVTVHGKNYWGFQTGPFTNGGASILSRIFASDLPMAGWVKNLAGCAAYSPKLQKILIPTGMDMFANIHNASSIFRNDYNLLSATNFETKFRWTRYVCDMFNGCLSMTTCDLRIPQNAIRTTAYQRVYKGCAKLAGNIADFLPERGFDGKKVDISECFMGCLCLTGTVPGAILWNDMVTEWTHTNTFAGCSADILAQVPVSWGGTASEVEDPKPITRSNAVTIIGAKVDEAMTNLNIPSGANAGRGNVLGGYGVKVTAYTDSDAGTTPRKLTLASADGDEIDWTKITADITIRVNDPGEVVTSGVGEDETEEDLLYLEATIKAVDSANGTIWISPWRYAGSTEGDTAKERAVSSGFASNVTDGKVFIRLADASRTDAAASSGDKNFVTGNRSYANGSWNTVTGDMSGADGSLNTVSGHMSFARGVSNTVRAENTVVDGNSNAVNAAASMSFVMGSGNELSNQSEYVFGDMNHMSGIGQIVIGSGHSGEGNRALFIGKRNVISVEEGIAIGYSLTVKAKNAMMFGRYGTLADSPENEGAFAVAGGEHEAEKIGMVHRINKKVLNPLYNSTLDTGNTGTDSAGEKQYLPEQAFSTEYRGRLSPVTLTVAVTSGATVSLDHDQFARWILSGSGAVTLALENWIDGDRGEVLVSTATQTLTFPEAWIVPEDFDITTTPGVYLLEIRKESGGVHLHKLLPFGGSGTGSASEIVIGENNHWFIDGVDSGVSATGPQGPQGDVGIAAGFGTPTATASTLAAGSSATVSVSASGSNTAKVFSFTLGVPKGDKGDKGDTGGSFVIQVVTELPENPDSATLYLIPEA